MDAEGSAEASDSATEHLGGAKRPQYLFSGLMKCGVCGAGFIMSGKNRLACFGVRDQKLLNLMLDDEMGVDEWKIEMKALDTRRNELQTRLVSSSTPSS